MIFAPIQFFTNCLWDKIAAGLKKVFFVLHLLPMGPNKAAEKSDRWHGAEIDAVCIYLRKTAANHARWLFSGRPLSRYERVKFWSAHKWPYCGTKSLGLERRRRIINSQLTGSASRDAEIKPLTNYFFFRFSRSFGTQIGISRSLEPNSRDGIIYWIRKGKSRSSEAIVFSKQISFFCFLTRGVSGAWKR